MRSTECLGDGDQASGPSMVIDINLWSFSGAELGVPSIPRTGEQVLSRGLHESVRCDRVLDTSILGFGSHFLLALGILVPIGFTGILGRVVCW